MYHADIGADQVRLERTLLRTKRERRPPAVRAAFSPIRLLDVVFAGLLVLLFTPLFLAVCCMIKVQDGGPILFRQARRGAGGKSFRCFKFRSMVVDAEARLAHVLVTDPVARAEWAKDHKLRKDPRITGLGAFLRQSSLDELPQLFNVLRGEMSLVGPRPIVDAEVPRYGPWFRHYCSATPGITGLWQISGRNDVSYRRRVAMDVLYARRRSVGLYLRILLLTVPCVLLRRGAY